jgi:diguanylate cyclase (GGDEF)-like protein
LISIRKHIDEFSKAGQSGMSDEALVEFRAMLLAIGRCGERAVPTSGDGLQQKMASLTGTLAEPVETGAVSKTGQQAQAELSQWAERAYRHHQELEREVREIVGVISTAAESLGERDARYANRLGELSQRLGSIAAGTDLAHMRQSIVENTRALKGCVEQMTEESCALVNNLTSEVKDYRTRLEKAERESNTDPLTEIANRRAFETDLSLRMNRTRPFSLIAIDLDGFKGVNDKYGHAAGDSLLRQFAGELKALFSMGDLVARLGGDEFDVLTDGGLEEALSKIERIQKWALGEYKIQCGGEPGSAAVKIQVRASIAAGEWRHSESAAEFVARVDGEVYKIKAPRDRRVGRTGLF